MRALYAVFLFVRWYRVGGFDRLSGAWTLFHHHPGYYHFPRTGRGDCIWSDTAKRRVFPLWDCRGKHRSSSDLWYSFRSWNHSFDSEYMCIRWKGMVLKRQGSGFRGWGRKDNQKKAKGPKKTKRIASKTLNPEP